MKPHLRLLPVPLAPMQNETIGSYLGRLADANRLPMQTLSNLLIDRNWPWRRDTTHCRYWTRETLLRLRTLTGRPATTLARALRLTQPPESAMHPVGQAAASIPRNACRLCAARHGIAGMVLLRSGHHESVCRRHRRWLAGPTQYPLDQLPQVIQASNQHRKLLRRHGIRVTETANLLAHEQTNYWFREQDSPADLWNRWDQRLLQLDEDPFGDPYRPSDHRIALAAYPEAVILASLLASPYWRDHNNLPAEIDRRLGLPPGTPPIQKLQPIPRMRPNRLTKPVAEQLRLTHH